eukprot:180096-Pelagomonas_calceolata.AAC.2
MGGMVPGLFCSRVRQIATRMHAAFLILWRSCHLCLCRHDAWQARVTKGLSGLTWRPAAE